MDWLEVSVETAHNAIESVCAALTALGLESLQIEDYEDFIGFLEENRKYWDFVDEELLAEKNTPTHIKFYLPAAPESMDTLTMLKKEMNALRERLPETDFGSLAVSAKEVNSETWDNAWMQYYKPFEVGKRLLVVPEWEKAPETDRTVFLNNPGASFGTGSHATTRLVLEALERKVEQGAVDIDPLAAETAVKNAALNHIGPDRFYSCVGDVIEDDKLLESLGGKRYDLIFANIVADAVIALLGSVKRALAQDGTFIASGIIAPRLREVLDEAEKAGLQPVDIEVSGGWCAITAIHADKR